MEKQRALDKLKELGIDTQNFYDKKTYIHDGEVCVGIFPVEANREDAFYFSVNHEDVLYMISSDAVRMCPTDKHLGQDKFQVPLKLAVELWKDTPIYEELPDIPNSKTTLRQLLAIHLKEPISGVDWLDAAIKKHRAAHTREIVREVLMELRNDPQIKELLSTLLLTKNS